MPCSSQGPGTLMVRQELLSKSGLYQPWAWPRSARSVANFHTPARSRLVGTGAGGAAGVWGAGVFAAGAAARAGGRASARVRARHEATLESAVPGLKSNISGPPRRHRLGRAVPTSVAGKQRGTGNENEFHGHIQGEPGSEGEDRLPGERRQVARQAQQSEQRVVVD